MLFNDNIGNVAMLKSVYECLLNET